MDYQSVLNRIEAESTSLRTSLSAQFPAIDTLLNASDDPEADWDFFVLAAGASLLLSGDKLDDAEQKALRSSLAQRDEELPGFVDECSGDLENAKRNPELTPAIALGFWVLGSIYKTSPSLKNVREGANALGEAITNLVED